jgi:hypothetical protein
MVFLVVTCLIPLSAFAQVVDSNSGKFSEYLRSGNDYRLGILDPSRLSFSHYISSSYISSGGEGVMRNLFMETIGYRLSNPLTLTFNVGYMHEPYSTMTSEGPLQSGKFLGSAALTWRPAENMFLHFEIANYPKYGYYGYSPYDVFMPRYAPMPSFQSDTEPRSDDYCQE